MEERPSCKIKKNWRDGRGAQEYLHEVKKKKRKKKVDEERKGEVKNRKGLGVERFLKTLESVEHARALLPKTHQKEHKKAKGKDTERTKEREQKVQ